MTKLKEVYKCAVCGNIVEVVNAAGGTLSCCGQPMDLLSENSTDAATEKHNSIKQNNKKRVMYVTLFFYATNGRIPAIEQSTVDSNK